MKQNQPISEDNQPNSGQSKVKEKKVNERKRNESKAAVGGVHSSFSEKFDDLEYRETLVNCYGEEAVMAYEAKFDKWVKDKKKVNVNKYEAIDWWLCEDFE